MTIWLLLGAIVNVLVAWAFAAQPARVVGTCGGIHGLTSLDTGDPSDPMHWFESREMSQPGVTRVRTSMRRPSTPIITAPDVGEVVPPWVDATPPSRLKQWTMHIGAGWPRRALHGRYIQTGPLTYETAHCLDLGRTPTDPWHHRGLPYGPVWRGFAANTLLFAAAIMVARLTPGTVRGALRRRRGACPWCGYPVGTSPQCTECGASVRTRL